MLDQIVRSATFGFGASAGRDIYKSMKKNPLLLVLIAAGLVIFGWRNYYMGVGHGRAYKIFVTCIGSTILVLLGAAIILGIGFAYSSEEMLWPIWAAIGLLIIFLLIGHFWGSSSRRSCIDEIEVLAYNQQFLADIGISDSAFEKDLLQDEDGNLLKLKEQTKDKIVFTVAGKRGLRSSIKLQNGRMVDYTGIVRI